MKSFIAIPLVLASATAESAAAPVHEDIMTRLQNMNNVHPQASESNRRRPGGQCSDYTKCEPCAAEDGCIFNLRVGRCVDKADRSPHEKWAMTADDCLDALPKYDLEAGATCAPGYEPLTSSWEDCAAAAKSMGFKGDAVNFVKYNKPWGTTRPEGCFRKGNGEFHFNDGAGGNFKGNDRILCVLEGEGPKNRNEAAGSSLESDIVIDTSFEESGPEGDAPIDHLDLDEEDNGGIIEHETGIPPGNATNTISTEAYRFYDEEEGWSKEAPVSRTVCGPDGRQRMHHTTYAPWKWIVDLEMTAQNGNKYICTGFLISKRAVMTAGHCLYMHNHGGWVKYVKVCPGRNGGRYPYGCQWANWFYTTGAWVRSRNKEYDYATLTVPDTTWYNYDTWTRHENIGYFGFTSKLSDVWAVNVAGYPSDKDGGSTLWWQYDSYTAKPRMLNYMADTAGGMSGGPVWAYYNKEMARRVVGIQAYGGCPNSAVRVTNQVYDWMMDFRNNYN